MNRLHGKRVMITGASSGIGEACARAFAGEGCSLILSARRLERLQELRDDMQALHGTEVTIERLDVRDRDGVERHVEALASAGRIPDILVNNAGLSRDLLPIHEGRVDGWEQMIDTNVKGLLYVTRAVLPQMVERDSGHVIQIGSVAGELVYPGGNVYNATKFAVRALNEAINLDVAGTKVRVSSVDPGLVETEFSEVRFRGDQDRAEAVYRGYTPLAPGDVADVVRYVANAPDHVNVHRVLVYPTDQRSPWVLHRDDPET